MGYGGGRKQGVYNYILIKKLRESVKTRKNMFTILSQQIMQIKTTLRFYLTSVRMVQYEKTNAGEHVGKGKSSFS